MSKPPSSAAAIQQSSGSHALGAAQRHTSPLIDTASTSFQTFTTPISAYSRRHSHSYYWPTQLQVYPTKPRRQQAANVVVWAYTIYFTLLQRSRSGKPQRSRCGHLMWPYVLRALLRGFNEAGAITLRTPPAPRTYTVRVDGLQRGRSENAADTARFLIHRHPQLRINEAAVITLGHKIRSKKPHRTISGFNEADNASDTDQTPDPTRSRPLASMRPQQSLCGQFTCAGIAHRRSMRPQR
jgi:hypothetical protein